MFTTSAAMTVGVGLWILLRFIRALGRANSRPRLPRSVIKNPGPGRDLDTF